MQTIIALSDSPPQTTTSDCAVRIVSATTPARGWVCTLPPGHKPFTIGKTTWDHCSHGTRSATIWKEDHA